MLIFSEWTHWPARHIRASGARDLLRGGRIVTSLTDPAREVLDLCKHLVVHASSSEPVHRSLARALGVREWSSDLFLVIDIINARIDELRKAIEGLSLEADLLAEADKEIKAIAAVFTHEYMNNNNMVSAKNSNFAESSLKTLRLLAPQIRTIISYPYIGEGEREEISADIRTLVEWLSNHQLRENDFIRAALIDGLNQALFRLEKMHFFGWAYTAASLKPVITAYMALERMNPNKANNPDVEIVLKKVRALCLSLYERMKLGKEAAEVGDFVLRLYGAASLAATPFVGISALLR